MIKGPGDFPVLLRPSRRADAAGMPARPLLMLARKQDARGTLMPDQVHEISHQLGMLKASVDTLTAEVHKLRNTAHEHNQALIVVYQTGDQVRGLSARIATLEKAEGDRATRRNKIIAFALGASLFGGGVGSAAGPTLWRVVRPWLML